MTTTELAPAELAEPQSRTRRMFWPVVGFTAAAAAALYVGRVDPNQPGHYPVCPLKLVTGLDCPGCGGLRCVHSLMNGDIIGAMDHNLLLVMLLPLVAVWAVLLLKRRWTGVPPRYTVTKAQRTRLMFAGLIALTVIFTVARNLSFVPFINSQIS